MLTDIEKRRSEEIYRRLLSEQNLPRMIIASAAMASLLVLALLMWAQPGRWLDIVAAALLPGVLIGRSAKLAGNAFTAAYLSVPVSSAAITMLAAVAIWDFNIILLLCVLPNVLLAALTAKRSLTADERKAIYRARQGWIVTGPQDPT